MNQTAEGVASCGPVLGLARAHGVEMPITEVVEAVMRDGLPVEQGRVDACVTFGQAGVVRSVNWHS